MLTFSLPAGHTCPSAHRCKAKADRDTGRITDGPDTAFRCYAASMEAGHTSVRDCRWHNFDLLRGKSRNVMAALILDSLPPFAGWVRVQGSGYFHSQEYFDAWLEVARRRARTTIYTYAKSLALWVARLGDIPDNFLLTASVGGTQDHVIAEYGLRSARVVFSEAEAAELGLEVDHDDSHAMKPGPSFALLVHGTQPAGTAAGRAVGVLRTLGEYGYGERADEIRRERGRFPLAVGGRP